MSSTRVYLGRLPPDVREDDIVNHFKSFKVKDIALRGNFGFIEFDNALDAEDAIREYDGRDFMGERIIVQPSRESRSRREDFDRPPMSRGPPRRGVRLHVIGIPERTSWQDLKDFGRQASQGIMYADVDRNDPTIGIIEFPNMAEAEDAISRLSGLDIRGVPVKLDFAPEGGAPGRGGGYAPRDFDRRPPPPSRDYDDRRGGGGYGGRQDAGGYAPRRNDYGGRDAGRDEPRRDESRRDEPRRDDYRRDDRPPRRDYDRDRSPPRRAERERYEDRQDRGSDRGQDRGQDRAVSDADATAAGW